MVGGFAQHPAAAAGLASGVAWAAALTAPIEIEPSSSVAASTISAPAPRRELPEMNGIGACSFSRRPSRTSTLMNDHPHVER
jgi:hypothetical protein